ncbi:helix-turn-helix transcriptional regulator [Micromonospora globbae]|uniref:Helix-turn-helix transcriptional regulator n=1 Tax=Micromonospora globbae TaxID=1894969 RepID=A0ABZ1RZ46_9ACTN|nr:helix-turn-helix transcriptional regulator [Micromonospora globbae]
MTGSWSSATELGAFLRSRRAALTPEETGVPVYGQRRVPGLRREELAQLAGISVTYYTRLEQGESHQISDSVLDSLARVLRLTPDERAYLRGLARPTRGARRDGEPERVRPGVRALVDAAAGQAAIIVGRRGDLLGGNRLGYALWGLPAPDPESGEPPVNIARITFLDPSSRDLFPDWERQARDITAYLRFTAARHPDDPELHALIGELSVRSTDFARIWAEHPVSDCVHSVREYRHPQVGSMILDEEIVRLTDDPGMRIIFSGAPEGTESAERLRLLGTLA